MHSNPEMHAPVARHARVSVQLRHRVKRFLIDRQWQRAIDTCSEALQLTPGSYKVLRLRALAFAALHDHDSALSAPHHNFPDVPEGIL
jgi:regulator of sirC expression with transglutaminase-like and TPR domain